LTHYGSECPVFLTFVAHDCVSFAKQENHPIAKMTARCAQYVSALKTVGLCKGKISRRLRKNLHVTNLSLFGGAVKLFWKYSIQCNQGT